MNGFISLTSTSVASRLYALGFIKLSPFSTCNFTQTSPHHHYHQLISTVRPLLLLFFSIDHIDKLTTAPFLLRTCYFGANEHNFRNGLNHGFTCYETKQVRVCRVRDWYIYQKIDNEEIFEPYIQHIFEGRKGWALRQPLLAKLVWYLATALQHMNYAVMQTNQSLPRSALLHAATKGAKSTDTKKLTEQHVSIARLWYCYKTLESVLLYRTWTTIYHQQKMNVIIDINKCHKS
jgi:hypothetical protein